MTDKTIAKRNILISISDNAGNTNLKTNPLTLVLVLRIKLYKIQIQLSYTYTSL
jgi:hypothetical protein